MRNPMSVEGDTWKLSMLVLTMALIHGYCHGVHQRRPYRPFSISRARPRASFPQDLSQAPQALTFPSFEGEVPSSPPDHRYATRRPPTSPSPNPSRPTGIALKAIIKRLMVTAPPIEGNSDCRVGPFHSELYFNIEAMRQQPELQDSFGLL
ncbi:hypothetical protein CK203_117083 [Vitis vinifera]|uniref:Uncharacterized protein n=1 Tax=Vitis vinifera TaxID=29760 RepID=A0A438C850_VITVI|nr:hypothetical protein CK203_117083 [Vitis vinifera]